MSRTRCLLRFIIHSDKPRRWITWRPGTMVLASFATASKWRCQKKLWFALLVTYSDEHPGPSTALQYELSTAVNHNRYLGMVQADMIHSGRRHLICNPLISSVWRKSYVGQISSARTESNQQALEQVRTIVWCHDACRWQEHVYHADSREWMKWRRKRREPDYAPDIISLTRMNQALSVIAFFQRGYILKA